MTAKEIKEIAKDAEKSYRYAANILKAPFPEGEAAIATDALNSYCYAIGVLRKPFPEGEAAITTSGLKEGYQKLFPFRLRPAFFVY